MRRENYIERIRRIGSLFLLGIFLLLPAQVRASEAEASCTVTLPITLSVMKNGKTETDLPDTAGKMNYEFLLTAEQEDTPLPEESKVVLTGAGRSAFGPIAYTKSGDYVYHIGQIQENEKDIVYDSTSYTVLVQIVWNAENELAAEICVMDDAAGAKTDQIEFSNLWKGSEQSDNKPAAVKPQTIKVVKRTTAAKTGDELEIGSIFAVTGVTLSAVILLSVLMIKEKKKKK